MQSNFLILSFIQCSWVLSQTIKYIHNERKELDRTDSLSPSLNGLMFDECAREGYGRFIVFGQWSQ